MCKKCRLRAKNLFKNIFQYNYFTYSPKPVHFISAHSMSFNHFTEQIFDDTIIDNKITAINSKDIKNHHDFLYPYNLTVFRIMPTLDNIRFTAGFDVEKYENSMYSDSYLKAFKITKTMLEYFSFLIFDFC